MCWSVFLKRYNEKVRLMFGNVFVDKILMSYFIMFVKKGNMYFVRRIKDIFLKFFRYSGKKCNV